MLAERRVDKIVKKINEITPQQLKRYGLDYLKCIRRKRYLFISSVFDMTFIVNMAEISDSLNGLGYGNKIFKSYAILVIDIRDNRYAHHLYFGIPNNLDLYNYSTDKNYHIITDSIKENPLIIKAKNYWKIGSHAFDTTEPVTRTRSRTYYIEGYTNQEINFDINVFIDKYMTWSYDGYIKGFASPFIYRHEKEETKEDLIKLFDCRCVEDKETLPLACFTCERKGDCRGHHVRKCSCGKFTYFRKNTCLKCHLVYSRSKKIQSTLNQKNFNHIYEARHTINNQIPTHHYNSGGGGGLCIGRGGNRLNEMMEKQLNPLRLMLAFKANLAYTDHQRTTSYYSKFKNRLTDNEIYEHSEFAQHMRGMFEFKNINPSYHVFTVYCYCPLCMFLKIMLHKKNIKIDPRGTEISKGAIISRDKFIEVYKGYLNRRRKAYQSSYLHEAIKEIINIRPIDFLTVDQL